MEGHSPPRTLLNLERAMWASATVWVATVVLFLCLGISEIRRGALDSAQAQAAASIEKDLLYRRWADMHGTLYVPVTEKTPPNPYLAASPERDITLPSGRQLTMMTPSYITRQVKELDDEMSGVGAGHITSLRPIRLENAADAWETEALTAFDRGATEAVTEATVNQQHVLRYMRPLIADNSCMGCHPSWDGRPGQVRGGLSVAVPMRRFDQEADERIRLLLLGLGVLLALGLLGAFWGMRGIRARSREKEQGEEALRASEKRYRTLLEALPDSVFTVDKEGNYTYGNAAAARMLGQEQLAGKSVREVFPPEIAERYLKGITGVFENGVMTRTADSTSVGGRKTWFDTILVPVRDARDNVVSVLGMARDVTAARQLEQELAQAQRMESVGRLAGGVAHDFNNLLTVINGFTDFVRNTLPEDDARRGDLDEVTRAAGRAKDLTRQLLAFARRDVTEPKVIHVDAAVRNVQKMLGRLLGEQIELSVLLGAGDARIRMDPAQLDQILVNLAVNAKDAMPNGGTLHVETSCVGGPLPGVAIRIWDNGLGISADVLPHIFEPFFTTKEAGKGTGLGLATCHGIAKQNGGHIAVTSQPGGTTFTVTFPHVEDAASGLVPVLAPATLVGRCTVLLVEDDDATRRVAAAMLRQTGYLVLEAPSGARALELLALRGAEIRLLLTDVVMPRMTGPELVATVRKERPDLAILFMSGYLGDQQGRTALPLGAQLLPKPFNVDELTRKVAGALQA